MNIWSQGRPDRASTLDQSLVVKLLGDRAAVWEAPESAQVRFAPLHATLNSNEGLRENVAPVPKRGGRSHDATESKNHAHDVYIQYMCNLLTRSSQ